MLTDPKRGAGNIDESKLIFDPETQEYINPEGNATESLNL
jgi:hypothetical protein